MTFYTSRLIVLPNYGNHLRSNSSSNSSYTFQHERFRSTLIVLPNSTGKRFIQGIEVQCGSFLPDASLSSQTRLESVSPIGTTSDVFSADESICEYHPTIGESYFDVRHRLLAKSTLFNHTINDETDCADDSLSYSSTSYSFHPHGNYSKK